MKILKILAFASALTCGASTMASAQDQASPTASSTATRNPALKSPSAIGTGPLAKGHNSFTKKEARARIRKAGYTNVAGLTLDSDGLWQAQATRNGKTANVALDYEGNVSAQ